MTISRVMRRVYERTEHAGRANTLVRVSDKTSTNRKPWVGYVVWRLIFFVVPFAIILPIALSTTMEPPLAGLIAAVLASLLGLSLSYLFLSRRREAVADALASARANRHKKNIDEAHEDEAVDRA